jgi:hypothetical protein
MTVSRRDVLKSLGAVAFVHLDAPADAALLTAIAEVVLPVEADRRAAVTAFTAWIAGFRENIDTDHGYGNTRLRRTGPNPSQNYPAQLAALDTAARAQGASSFTAASLDQRRAIVEAAIAAAKIERLPARPNGAHVATDLMGHYFNSEAANDLCYRAAIRRDSCRGLPGSVKPPAPLSFRLAPRK